MYCVHCGAENPGNATFCQKCGKQLPTTDQDEPTVSSIPSSLATLYGNTPHSNTPSAPAETVYAPPPPSYVPNTGKNASPPAQKPKRRRGLVLSLVIIAVVVIIAAGAYVYLNLSTPDKTITTYYSALVHNDFQTAYGQFSTAAHLKKNLLTSGRGLEGLKPGRSFLRKSRAQPPILRLLSRLVIAKQG